VSRKPRLAYSTLARIGAAAVAYAALHLLFSALPHTLPAGEWYLDLRPQVVAPLAAGLLAGPGAGALVGGLGRLGGDLLAGAGPDAPGLAYSVLLGLIAGLGRKPQANFRILGPLLWALLWAGLAAAAAALAATWVLEAGVLGHNPPAGVWPRALSEVLSGVVAVVLLLPGVLFISTLATQFRGSRPR
jgi:hypothetical protein